MFVKHSYLLDLTFLFKCILSSRKLLLLVNTENFHDGRKEAREMEMKKTTLFCESNGRVQGREKKSKLTSATTT